MIIRSVTSSIPSNWQPMIACSVIMIITLLVSPCVVSQTPMTMTVRFATLSVGHAVAVTHSSVIVVMIQIIISRIGRLHVPRRVVMASFSVTISAMMEALMTMMDVRMIVTTSLDSIVCLEHHTHPQYALRYVVMADTSTTVVTTATLLMVTVVTQHAKSSMVTPVTVVGETSLMSVQRHVVMATISDSMLVMMVIQTLVMGVMIYVEWRRAGVVREALMSRLTHVLQTAVMGRFWVLRYVMITMYLMVMDAPVTV